MPSEFNTSKKGLVRTASAADELAVSEICLKTAASGEDATDLYSRADLPGLVWAVPYLFFQPECCFVAELEEEVVGYIVTCANTRDYERWLNTIWNEQFETRLSEFAPNTDADKNAITAAKNHLRGAPSYADEFPAHLHINLLPKAQGTGLGRRLIEAAEKQLSVAGAKGLHLGVSPANVRAIGFYNAMGFLKLENAEGYVMAKTLI